MEEDLEQDTDNQSVTRDYLDKKFKKTQSLTRKQHEKTRSTIKNDLEKLQSTILNKFDESHRQLIEELTSQMDVNRLVMLEKIYATVEEISVNETEKFLTATQQLLENAELPNKAKVKEKINDPKINANAKLKIAIPVWSLVNFEAEAGVEWEESIPKLWEKFKDFFKEGYKNAGPTLRGLNK
ncbi:MAG: hypothetical protein U5K69_09740 [Balneolaceae bacterium]|nr:hypothetical protein [Balneolaceae bacterium]